MLTLNHTSGCYLCPNILFINPPPNRFSPKCIALLVLGTSCEGILVRLDSGRELYPSRSFYHMGTTTIDRGGILVRIKDSMIYS